MTCSVAFGARSSLSPTAICARFEAAFRLLDPAETGSRQSTGSGADQRIEVVVRLFPQGVVTARAVVTRGAEPARIVEQSVAISDRSPSVADIDQLAATIVEAVDNL